MTIPIEGNPIFIFFNNTILYITNVNSKCYVYPFRDG